MTDTVTDRDIKELSEEAGAAGDSKTLADCAAAVDGDAAARARCERIIIQWRRERAAQVSP